jgi:hypothetical protein
MPHTGSIAIINSLERWDWMLVRSAIAGPFGNPENFRTVA